MSSNAANSSLLQTRCCELHTIIILIYLAIVCSSIQLTEQLKFSSVQIPALVQRNTNFWLICQFEANEDQLYSVKWYKNNEEFYRLLFGDSPQQLASSPDTSASGQQQQAQQQQYFAQAGVNVMMSSSNATHVRLLNASLESEGLYACEISTQNLSTIRYEKEIRVYVLPHSKLNIIGFKSRYALGDKVDLICSSDYSRPQPALAWFINGQRIAESSRWFELEAQSKSKLNEPSLFKLNLALKFKLSAQFLAALSASNNNDDNNNNTNKVYTDLAGGSNQRNQSHRRQSVSASSSPQTAQSALSPYQLQQQQQRLDSSSSSSSKLELKLQCKYKLTEVSDVTFNELVTRQVEPQSLSSASTSSSLFRPSAKQRKLAAASNRKPTTDNEWRSKRWIGSGGATKPVRLSKSADNQVTQSKCPASGHDIWRAITRQSSATTTIVGQKSARSSSGHTSCQMGSLVLQPDDPVIVELDSFAATKMETTTVQVDSLSLGEEEEPRRRRRRRRRRRQVEATASGMKRNENSIGDLVSVNCSTISALVDWSPPAASELDTAYDDDDDDDDDNNNGADDEHDDEYVATKQLRQQQFASTLLSRPEIAPIVGASGQKSGQSSSYCGDSAARRRSVISGKYYTNEDQSWSNQSQRSSAIVSRPGVLAAGHKSQQQQQQYSPSSSGSGGKYVAYLSLMSEQPKPVTTDQVAHNNIEEQPEFGAAGGARQQPATGQRNNSIMTTNGADSSDSFGQLLAPPLLEWFINNQEAPRSSASYAPPLPLLAATGRRAAATRAAASDQLWVPAKPLGGATSRDKQADQESDYVLPSIDYTQYFANFDSRPIQQHLALTLTLDKKHFMTPDSKLRLRCSSTQAQVLMLDSLTLNIIPIPAGDNYAAGVHHGWQQRPHHHQRQQHYYQKSSPNQARSSVMASSRGSNAAASPKSPNLSKLLTYTIGMVVSVALYLYI